MRRFNVAEWVARGLGADEVSERSLASRTGWLDLAQEAFDPELLAWSGAAASLMPPLVAAGQPIGTACHPLLAGAVVTIAGHDHQAAAVGTGVAGAGDVLDSHGSAEAVLRTVTAGLGDRSRSRSSPPRASPPTSACGSGTGRCSAARRAGWCCGTRSTSSASPGPTSPSSTPPRSPPIPGRTPHWAERVPTGTGRTPTRPGRRRRRDVARVIEAETCAAAERIATMARIVGPHHRLVVTGGWCASAAVLAAKRRLFGPLVVADVAEAGTLGAATLAARAAGDLGPADALA